MNKPIFAVLMIAGFGIASINVEVYAQPIPDQLGRGRTQDDSNQGRGGGRDNDNDDDSFRESLNERRQEQRVERRDDRIEDRESREGRGESRIDSRFDRRESRRDTRGEDRREDRRETRIAPSVSPSPGSDRVPRSSVRSSPGPRTSLSRPAPVGSATSPSSQSAADNHRRRLASFDAGILKNGLAGESKTEELKRAKVIGYIPDDEITRAIEDRLFHDESSKAQLIDVKTMGGVVTLFGSVRNGLSKERAGQIAESMDGVLAVINKIQIVSG